MTDRLNWDEYFAKIVSVTAERSSCHRLHVGCLLVKNNNKVFRILCFQRKKGWGYF